MRPCPKCGSTGHDARKHNGAKPGHAVSPRSLVVLRHWRLRHAAERYGNDPVTEHDWSELDDLA